MLSAGYEYSQILYHNKRIYYRRKLLFLRYFDMAVLALQHVDKWHSKYATKCTSNDTRYGINFVCVKRYFIWQQTAIEHCISRYKKPWSPVKIGLSSWKVKIKIIFDCAQYRNKLRIKKWKREVVNFFFSFFSTKNYGKYNNLHEILSSKITVFCRIRFLN